MFALECWQGGGRPTLNTLLIFCGVADSHPPLTRGAVSPSDGFSCSPAGRGAIFATDELFLSRATDSASMSLQCELVIFLQRLQFPSRSPLGDVYLRMVSATFCDLFNSKRLLPLPPFINHCPLAPPSVCLPFYSAPPRNHPIPIPHALPLANVFLNSGIINRGSSWRLISQHKSLSLGCPVLTRRPLLPPPSLPPEP